MIYELLEKIKKAIYGKDVRQSIHDAIEQCYKDATGNPESVAAVVESQKNLKGAAAEVNTRLDEIVAATNNCQTETVLWTGDATYAGCVLELSEPLTNFNYIDIMYGYVGSQIIQRMAAMGTNNVLRGVNLADALNSNPPVFTAGEMQITVSDDRQTITVNNAMAYKFDGTESGTSEQVYIDSAETAEAESYRAGHIYKITGVKILENAELTDIRVDAFGGMQETAGTAVRNQVKSLYDALWRKRGLNEMSWDKDNVYGHGEVVKKSGYIRGYDVNQSPVTPVYSDAPGYEVWKISMSGLSDLEIPLLAEYPDEQCRVLMLLRPADGIMLLRSGLSTASYSWLNLDEKNGVIKLSNLSYLYKQGYTELYVTLLTGKGDVYAPSSITEHIGENTIRTSSLVEQAELVAYNQLRLAEGEEFTAYADNILLHDSIKNYAAVEIIPSGMTNYVLQEGRITFNGSDISSSGGSLTFNYYKNDTAHVSLSKKINVYRVNKTAGTGKTIQCHVIGDSITNAGFYLKKVVEKLETDTLNVNFMGSNPSSSSANGKEFTWSNYKGQEKPPADGLSGWSAYSLTHCQSFNGFINPFYNPDTCEAFDYSYYMEQQGYDGVDMVLLNLGMNGVTVAVNGTYPTYEQDLEAYRSIISSIKKYNDNIKILLWLTPLPCQETTADILEKDKRLTIHKQLIDAYSSSYMDGIYIYDAGMCCESRTLAYTQKETKECAGIDTSTDQTPTMQMVADKLHPQYPGPGYRQMASMVYSAIKWIAPQCNDI